MFEKWERTNRGFRDGCGCAVEFWPFFGTWTGAVFPCREHEPWTTYPTEEELRRAAQEWRKEWKIITKFHKTEYHPNSVLIYSLRPEGRHKINDIEINIRCVNPNDTECAAKVSRISNEILSTLNGKKEEL